MVSASAIEIPVGTHRQGVQIGWLCSTPGTGVQPAPAGVRPDAAGSHTYLPAGTLCTQRRCYGCSLQRGGSVQWRWPWRKSVLRQHSQSRKSERQRPPTRPAPGSLMFIQDSVPLSRRWSRMAAKVREDRPGCGCATSGCGLSRCHMDMHVAWFAGRVPCPLACRRHTNDSPVRPPHVQDLWSVQSPRAHRLIHLNACLWGVPGAAAADPARRRGRLGHNSLRVLGACELGVGDQDQEGDRSDDQPHE